MNFFNFLNFPLKSSEIPVGLRFQLASVTINFTDNHDYRAVLYSMPGGNCPPIFFSGVTLMTHEIGRNNLYRE